MTEDERYQSSRRRLLDAALAHVPFEGWTAKALEAGARDAGIDPALVPELFPRGPADAVELFSRVADKRMAEDVAAEGDRLSTLRTAERVALAVRLRLERSRPHRAAIRQSLSLLALPVHAPLAARLLHRTVDAIWYAVGDRSTDFSDFSYYTKRGLLAAAYGATLLYWLADRSPGQADSWAFLDRRLADAMRAGLAARRAGEAFGRLPDPFRLIAGLRRGRR
jgi:ubiquinone biosynthesis protein COQ9